MTRYLLKSIFSVAALLCVEVGPLGAGNLAYAADYPTRPIRMIVPYPPGGAGDLVARPVAQMLSISLGQPVVVENRVGASGVIGTELAARSAPNGYTLLAADSGALVINPAVYKSLPYRTLEDFDPISLVVTSAFVMVAHPSLQVSSVKDLIAVSKKSNVDYGSAGNGSLHQMIMEWFKSLTGTNFTHIPYKGAQSFNAVVAGEVKVVAGSVLGLMPFINSGRVNAIAVTSRQRSGLMPNVPTVAESGIPGFDATNWYGILAPHGTPKNIISELNAHLVKIVRSPEMKERFAKGGAEAVGTSPTEFAEVMRVDLEKWAKVAKNAGVKVD